VDPVTHTLASLALARAGLKRATRLATPMLLASGLAADLDWLSQAGGPRAFLHGHRTATHSLAGTAAIALGVAVVFWRLGRRQRAAPVRFLRAAVVCALGAGLHLLLDLANSYGVQLLWPFRGKWFAWDLMEASDPWVLGLLVLGMLLPELFRLVSEEIGARPRARGAQRGAIFALALLAAYGGARWALHARAVELLRSHIYRGAVPLAVGVFPRGPWPLRWSGVVETENTLEQIEVSLAPGGFFDPDRARRQFKPEASPQLEAAQKSAVAREYLPFARFPKASVQTTEEGYRVELRDLRFASASSTRRELVAVIDLNRQVQVIHQELRFELTGRK